jgi:nickel transport system substrate-binding protein
MRLQGFLLAGVVVFSGAVGSVHAQETLNFSWALNVGPMNPHVTAPNQMFAQTMIYESLVKYQPDGSIAPWLAQSWDISEDGKTYTFQLRQDVTFSNGEAFDAAAVKANFDAILTNHERLAWLELVNRIAGTSVVDAFTFQLTLNDPYYPTLYDLALPRPFRFLAPSQIPETGSTAEGVIAPVGTGPFTLAESALGVSDTFSRNESYWGEPAGYDRVVVKVVPDANTRSIAFDTGEIDLIYGTEGQISPDTFERYRASGDPDAVGQFQSSQSRGSARAQGHWPCNRQGRSGQFSALRHADPCRHTLCA